MASSSRGVQQDSFIDDDDLTCPLCVEEFDLSDRNFKPCPCGYQVCQFCFNNIKNNMNGLCPACRRPYNEKTIEWKVVTPEEIAQFKANVQKNAKKKAEQRHKEAQKREVESLNRKHLAGLRVVQPNLAYVVGLSPGIPEQDLLQTLRGDKYFGQYGKIIKIVVSKAKAEGSQTGTALGVYVTFARNEDAARCIQAVHGSQNGDRILRAQLGTTKYCSAYLRNEVCTNKSCMFLHEAGENDDSYSRQDLSSINSVSTQRPLPIAASGSTSVARQVAQAQAPIQQAQPIAAASQPMARDPSKEGSESGDGSALPSSASWAIRGQQFSRRGSLATSGSISSPAISHALPVQEEPSEEASDVGEVGEIGEDQHSDNATSNPMVHQTQASLPPIDPVLQRLLRSISNLGSASDSSSESDHTSFRSKFPPLFDDNGGLKRRILREQQEEARLQIELESHHEFRPVPEAMEEEEPESGSLQLGGEPEDRDDRDGGSQTQSFHDQRRPSAQLPIQRLNDNGLFGSGMGQTYSQNIGNLSSINGRSLTPMQQQQLLLLKSGQNNPSFMEQYSAGISGGLGSSQSGLFQQQGHNRQSSRYNFANENNPSASTKLGVSAKNPMMPPQQGGSFYGSSMPGPPPGLKSTATPPINANGMFTQAHGFGGSNFGALTKDNNSDAIREMLRNRGAGGLGQGHDAGKHDQGLLSLDEASMSVDALVAESVSDTGSVLIRGDFDMVSRSSTPSVPPGLSLPHAHPSFPIIREDPIAKPASRILPTSAPFTPSRTAASAFIPRPATPLTNVSYPHTPTKVVAPSNLAETLGSPAKRDVKTLAADVGLSSTIASQARSVIQPEDFPVLEKGKAREDAGMVDSRSISTPTTKKASVVTPAVPSTPVTVKVSSKRSTPGILNISVPTPTKEVVSIESPVKRPSVSGAFPPLPPSTPVSSAQAAKAPPKALRVVPTPKTESPPISASTPLSAAQFVSVPSRQPNMASVSRLERPSTPVSEIISDNASLTSASISRPGSPPITRVGSAPVRSTTKSQQKKQRRQKDKSDLGTLVDTPEPEVEVAPILGRKKKQKKEKSSAAGGSTPIASRPPSPKPAEIVEVQKPGPTEANSSQNSTTHDHQLEPESNLKVLESKGKGKAKSEELSVTEPRAPTIESVPETTEKLPPSPMSVLQDLISSGVFPDPNKLAVLKAPNSFSQRLESSSAELLDLDDKLVITEEDRNALLAGKPVFKGVHGQNRVMLTPNGDCVRNLTTLEEERYLELQSRIFGEAGPAAFVPARHNASNGFTLIGGRAVPNGPPTFFPPADSNIATIPLDPVSKIQRDEALRYINQYVLPSLSTNSQLERALNANALDGEIVPPNDSQTWGGWGVGVGHGVDALGTQGEHHAGVETPYGSNSNEGILATGLESMTAHFAVGRETSRNQPLGNVSLLSLADSETAMQSAKKETEKLEKSLNQLLKKNRRLLLGAGH